jgi:hypothetical protein
MLTGDMPSLIRCEYRRTFIKHLKGWPNLADAVVFFVPDD